MPWTLPRYFGTQNISLTSSNWIIHPCLRGYKSTTQPQEYDLLTNMNNYDICTTTPEQSTPKSWANIQMHSNIGRAFTFLVHWYQPSCLMVINKWIRLCYRYCPLAVCKIALLYVCVSLCTYVLCCVFPVLYLPCAALSKLPILNHGSVHPNTVRSRYTSTHFSPMNASLS